MTRRRVRAIWYEVAVLLIGLGTIVLLTRLFTPLGGVLVSLGSIMIAVPVLWWFIRLGWRIGGEIWRELEVASTPVPTPAEIALRLQHEWGRPATLPEVAAVHQMLSNRRNEAFLDSGLALGALYLIDRNVK